MTGPARRVAGVLAPVTTPFATGTGELALESLRDNIHRLLADGLDGIVVAGTTGEAALLEPEEQCALIECARAVVPGDRWLIAGTGAESTRATIALSRAAADAGADAVLVRPPSYFSAAHTAESLETHYRAVADATPRPVLLYNIPKYTRLPIAADSLARLTSHGNIAGVKDSSGDMANLQAYRAAAPGWSVLVGSGSLLLPALECGCDGGIVAVACFAARLAVDVRAAFLRHDGSRAASLQARLAALDKEIVGRLGPAGVKAAMDAVGLYGGPARDPLAPLPAPDRTRIGELLAA
jgi:4-hydroxy-2-oxoglutarate aldolase